VIITDKLRSYGVAQRQMLPHVEHRQSRYLNNRAKTHIDRHDAENGRCSGSNRPSRRSTFSPLTRSFTTISIHADIDCQPRPTARCARWPSMSGGRRPASGVWDNLPNIIDLPPRDLPQINVTMPVFGLKGHSLVFDTGAAIPAEALFLEYVEARALILTPEIFPRADGTTYVCAISSSAPIPTDPDLVFPDDGAIDRLKALCARISPILASSRVLSSQACFRPVTQDGLPLIGAVPGVPGAFVATGHSVWGILNAPATGEAVAELMLDGATRAVDLSCFDPARLGAMDPGHVTVRHRPFG